jgi:3-methyladenine DNA glycosylase/8-oxoguanine DNA glycosylase
MPLEDLVAAITAVRGLGPWTAGYLALRMGERDAFPASDLGLRRAASPAEPVTTAALLERAAGWRPFRASAAVRLWMSE